jgi:Recombinase zinc beta ribbon domain/MerR family regulatory protein
LLAGLLTCGRCGQRMMIGYCKGGRPFYFCHRLAMNYGGPSCQRIAAVALDDLIGREVLRAVEPAALDLAFQAAGDLACERERLERHWRQQLDRARHDVDRAARQFHAVDPENRLVAAELERRWEQALSGQRDLQDQHDRFASQRPRELADADRDLIRSLSADLPRLWHAGTTTAVDRKLVVRHLVERIVVDVRGSSEMIDVEVRWAGGHASHHEARRPINNYERLHNFALLKERVTTLRREGRTAGRIAEVLNGEGFVPPKGPARYDRILVQKLMRICGLPGPLRREFHGGVALGDGEWWLGDLAKELGISRQMLRRWADQGLVRGRRDATGLRRWILWADAPELDRLRQLAEGRSRTGEEIPIRAGSIGDGAHRIETPTPDSEGRSPTSLPGGA